MSNLIAPREISESIAQKLHSGGYALVDFSPPKDVVTKIMAGWNEFLHVPAEERMRWRVGNPKDWDDGYVPRDGKGCDNKHFFHYRPYLSALLEHAATDYSQQREWLKNLDILWHYCRSRFLRIMTDLDECIPGYDFGQRFMSSFAKTRHAIRLLSYNERLMPGQLLGKPHTDRNFGTFQVYETHPALVLEIDGKEIEYRPVRDRALVFTGDKAQKLTGGFLPAVPHKIVVPADFTARENEARQSIVFFAHTDL